MVAWLVPAVLAGISVTAGWPPTAAAVSPWLIRTVVGGAGRGVARNVSQVPESVAAGRDGDGGPAAAARLRTDGGVAIDTAGNLLIADSSYDRVRVVASGTFYGQAMTAGNIYTIAGSGRAGFGGDSGPATLARLFDPVAVAINPSGNIVFIDQGNRRVRIISR